MLSACNNYGKLDYDVRSSSKLWEARFVRREEWSSQRGGRTMTIVRSGWSLYIPLTLILFLWHDSWVQSIHCEISFIYNFSLCPFHIDCLCWWRSQWVVFNVDIRLFLYKDLPAKSFFWFVPITFRCLYADSFSPWLLLIFLSSYPLA